MLAHGNSDRKVLEDNMLKLTKYECFLVRDKGIDGSIIDKPENGPFVMQDVQRCVRRFLPWKSIEDVQVVPVKNGYRISLNKPEVEL